MIGHPHIAVEFPWRTEGGAAVDPAINVNDSDEFAAAERIMARPSANES
jgi:hypothetical protein